MKLHWIEISLRTSNSLHKSTIQFFFSSAGDMISLQKELSNAWRYLLVSPVTTVLLEPLLSPPQLSPQLELELVGGEMSNNGSEYKEISKDECEELEAVK